MLDDFLDGAPRYKVDFGSRHPAALAMGLDLTIFDSVGVTEHPTDFAGLKARTTAAPIFFKAVASQISTGFGEYSLPNNGDQFASLFTGFVSIDTEGTWEFGVDGDDAVSVEIGDTLVSGYYGGHGSTGDYGASHRGSIYLTKGLHRLTFRHEEIDGGNSAVLGYRSPAMIAAGSPMAIAPPELFRRPTNPTFTVIAATTRLRAGTTTLTVRA
ncbi:PA14 domain-containing protein [Sphingomonas melonis]